MSVLIRSSSMDRALSCPASIGLELLVDPRDGDEGHEGTWVHHQIADRLIRLHGAIPPDGGLPPANVPATYKPNPFTGWLVDWAVRHVLETIPADWSIMVEVEMEHAYGRWTNRGHADIVAFSPNGRQAKGIDWKTGRDPVDPADENEQVLSYETLIKHEWPSVEEVEFQICQPLVSEDDGFQRVSASVLAGVKLENAAPSLDARMGVSLDNPRQLNSGRKQCNWCPVARQCPAVIAERELMKMTLTDEHLAAIKRQPDDTTLADWLVAGKIIDRPLNDAKEYAKERIKAMGAIVASDGTQVTQKVQKGAYEVTDPKGLWTTLHELLPEDKLAMAADWSMTRIKDGIAEHMSVPKTGSAAVTATSVFDAKIRSHVEQGDKTILQFL